MNRASPPSADRATGPADLSPASGSSRSSTPDAVRLWLVSMTKQGEDRVWRGAEKALACFDAMAAEIDWLKRPRFGEPGYDAPEPVLHTYEPHFRWPWFCGHCGYPEHERLKHFPRDSDGNPEGRDAERLDGEAATARAEGIAPSSPSSSTES